MGTELGSKGFRYKKAFITLLPILQISKEEQKPFEILVDYIMFAKEQDMNIEALQFESIIDGMVYDLYFPDDMKKADCFISDEVKKLIKKFDNKEDTIKNIYKTFKENKIISEGLINSKKIDFIKTING